jgi:hypothetical protein
MPLPFDLSLPVSAGLLGEGRPTSCIRVGPGHGRPPLSAFPRQAKAWEAALTLEPSTTTSVWTFARYLAGAL